MPRGYATEKRRDPSGTPFYHLARHGTLCKMTYSCMFVYTDLDLITKMLSGVVTPHVCQH